MCILQYHVTLGMLHCVCIVIVMLHVAYIVIDLELPYKYNFAPQVFLEDSTVCYCSVFCFEFQSYSDYGDYVISLITGQGQNLLKKNTPKKQKISEYVIPCGQHW